ncbi:MAG: alpha/beta fold hydrolase, partial [Bacteroidetes bacterium]|nr:alpha/beta fold hydrolase [Bacteroidota bacterium]
SCSRDDDPFADNEYLLSGEKIFTTPKAAIINLISLIGAASPEVAALTRHVRYDVDVYIITYRSTLYNDNITASGLVCVPVANGAFPVLSFQNGTNTIHANAPSVNPADFSYQLIQNVASMGFVVIIPDYPGFGSSQEYAHPYLLKEPTVQSVADMLASLREFDDDVAINSTLTDDLFLFGYSQGGWATLALHKEFEPEGVAGFSLAASAAGAGPADLKEMLTGLLADAVYPMPSYLAYIAHAYRTYNRFDNPYTDIFNEPFASRIPGFFNGQLSTGAINDQLTTDIAALLNPAFRSGFGSSSGYSGIRQALQENGTDPWNTTVPLLLVHGEADTQVPVGGTVTFHQGMLAAGSSPSMVTLVTIPGVGHGDGLLPAAVASLEFIISFNGNR